MIIAFRIPTRSAIPYLRELSGKASESGHSHSALKIYHSRSCPVGNKSKLVLLDWHCYRQNRKPNKQTYVHGLSATQQTRHQGHNKTTSTTLRPLNKRSSVFGASKVRVSRRTHKPLAINIQLTKNCKKRNITTEIIHKKLHRQRRLKLVKKHEQSKQINSLWQNQNKTMTIS